MDQDKSLKAESILKLTLEIIHLLTGENYTVVKKTYGELHQASGRRTKPQSPIEMPQSWQLERDSEKMILELADKIIELLTGEVPTEQYLEEPKDLDEDDMENNEPFSSPEGSSDRNKAQRLSSPLYPDYTDEEQSDQQEEESFQIKVEVVEEEDNKELYGVSDVQCKKEEIPVDISTTNAHNIRNSSPYWEEEEDDANDVENSPEQQFFQNRHPALQEIDDGEETSDKSTLPPCATAHDDKIFTCAECGKCFSEHDALLVHQRSHVEEKSYLCSSCGKCFKKKSNLMQHQKIHTGEKPFLCSDCGKSFTRKADLVKHQRIHTGEKPFPCKACGRCFTQISALIRHRRFHSDGRMIKNTTEDLYMFSSNSKVEDNPVSRENASFVNIHPVLQDTDINSNPSKDPSSDLSDFLGSGAPKSDKVFPCLECDKSFTQYTKLLIHQRSHTGEKPFSCSCCGKSFTEKSNLIQHERIHSGEKRFICSECSKGFTRKADLIKHLRIHTGEKPFHCLLCDKCFTQNSALLRHMKFHTGEKPFVCLVCGKRFMHRSGFNSHQKLHSQEQCGPHSNRTDNSTAQE
ncbi:uncharacterized protein ACNLHF_020582 isoform 1-T2 [Anomaloglossus baeobatrachus]|uniref:uncharacterized protein LOC142311118 n=1 Tax=Anomaloglossus baeobatrachus TaxID=238106 RepID=UPI003F500701